jgi:hypothetical protein
MIERRTVMLQRLAFACLLGLLAFGPSLESPIAAFSFGGNVLNYQAKGIYHNDLGGYSAWVGLWKMPGGRIQCDFTQIMGPVTAPVWNAPILESSNNGGSWSMVNSDLPVTLAYKNPRCPGYYQSAPNAGRGMWVADDGQTMVRPVWNQGDDGFAHGYLQRSTNGGQTWSSPINVPAGSYGSFSAFYPTSIKQVTLGDGNPALVLAAGCCPSSYTGSNLCASLMKEMFISTDQGQTWGSPIELMPPSTGLCEESDFVQLPNGNLMWLHRTEHFDSNGNYLYTDRMESISTRAGTTFVSQPAYNVPFPHSGAPFELMTREGIILDLCTTGSHWSADNGVTWNSLLVNGSPLATYYYPKAVQTADGTIVVVGHTGGDDMYGTVDQTIMQQTFRLSVHAPEPSGFVLAGTGLLGFAAHRWRRRRRTTTR